MSQKTYTAEEIKPGIQLACNGYLGTVKEVCTGDLAGMAVVRLKSGEACVSIVELVRFQKCYVEH